MVAPVIIEATGKHTSSVSTQFIWLTSSNMVHVEWTWCSPTHHSLNKLPFFIFHNSVCRKSQLFKRRWERWDFKHFWTDFLSIRNSYESYKALILVISVTFIKAVQSLMTIMRLWSLNSYNKLYNLKVMVFLPLPIFLLCKFLVSLGLPL